MLRLALAALLFLAPAAIAAQDVTMDERREADGTTTLSHAIVIDAPVADVWAAISNRPLA